MSQRIDILLSQATESLTSSNTARLDAELLLAHLLDKPRSYFFTWPEIELDEQQCRDFQYLIEKRKNGTPVAHLTGEREFWTLKLKVNNSTLIPRPDTELLVELALAQDLQEESLVIDLGTGTGAIALALATERPDWQVIAVEKNPEAISLAKENTLINKIKNVRILEGSWFAPLSHLKADMIVSNPPYIQTDDKHLFEGDVRFEPLSALTAGRDGLNDIRLIARESINYLKPGGFLLLEHGYNQGKAVRDCVESSGFQHAKTYEDLSGQDRVTLAKTTKSS